ncbi:S8 family peptidase [Streptomyces sp. AJS327]|uniref:S8 family peptidase n=1 Tax=Streptomyces sp. AJS327 TaxID=2545265 RepID=UPI0015E02FAA|nr:S8 family peptidase [Streptomyces sp. AJS327]MBA0050104.1 S8 family peptidase [Streptomyces sp. AJS327]
MAVTRKKLAVGISAAAAAVALSAVALPANAAPSPAEGTVVGANSANAVKGSYIVTMKKSEVKAASAEGKSVVKEHGGTVDKTFTHALNGYSAKMTESEAKKLAADPAVEKVFANQKHKISADQANPPSWGLDRIDTPELNLDDNYTYPDSAGEGVTAYVIDTGVRVSHSDFGDRAADGYDAVDGDDEAQDGNGHGTHVASTVAGEAHGVAKKANIVAVRVLDDNGSGTTAGVVEGIDWVTENADGPSVANMSLGGGADEALDEAVRNSVAAGITYAVAAGNEGTDAGNSSPARVEEAITVGATDDTDAQASFSNYGSVLDIYAPGVDITGAWNTDDDATDTISGTSMASPHVAGAAAVYLAGNTDATPEQVSTALVEGGSADVVGNPGEGSPNVLLNVVE